MKYTLLKRLCLFILLVAVSATYAKAQVTSGGSMLGPSCVFPGYPVHQLTATAPVGGTAPFTYQWQQNTGSGWVPASGVNTEYNYSPGVIVQNTVYQRVCWDANNSMGVTDQLPIVIITMPIDPGTISTRNYLVCPGSSIELLSSSSAAGFGDALFYQWQDSTVGGSWQDIDGAIRGTFSYPNIYQLTFFRRIASDACSGERRYAISNVFSVDVNPPLLGGSITPLSQFVVSGNAGAIINEATPPNGGSGNYVFQWQISTDGGNIFANIPSGAGNPFYDPGVITAARAYRRLTIDVGCQYMPAAISDTAFIYITTPLNPGDIVPTSGCVFPGNTPSLITTGGTPPGGGTMPYTYEWEYMNTSNPVWTPIPLSNSENYQPPVLSETTSYRRKITDAANVSDYTAPVTITLLTANLSGGSIAAGVSSFCVSGVVGTISNTVSAADFGAYVQYEWEMSNDGVNWTNIPGTIGLSSYTDNSTISQTTYYRRKVTDGCGGVFRDAYSNVVVVTIGSGLNGGSVVGGNATCYPINTVPPAITNSTAASNNGDPITYQWEMSNDGGSSWQDLVAETSQDLTVPALTESRLYRRRAIDNCGVAHSNIITYNVGSLSINGGIIFTQNPVLCAGPNTTLLYPLVNSCGNGSLQYQWEYDTGLGFNDVPGETGPTLNASYAPITIIYRRKVTDACGSAYSNILPVVTAPSLQPASISPANAIYCASTATPPALTIDNSCDFVWSGLQFTWEAWNTNTLNWDVVYMASNYGEYSYSPSDGYIAGLGNSVMFRLKITDPCSGLILSNTALITRNINCRVAPVKGQGQPKGLNKWEKESLRSYLSAKEKPSVPVPVKPGIQVFPNPVVNNQVTVTIADATGPFKVALNSIDGRQLPVTISSQSKGQLQLSFNQKMTPGTYVLQIMSNNKEWTEKIVVR